jgi:hypothetical protein
MKMTETLSHRNRLKIVVVVVIGFLLLATALAYYQNRESVSAGSSTSSAQTSSTPNASSSATSSSLLAPSASIPLGMTQGRIDHFSVDLNRGLLFVAGYGNDTVGIVDIKSSQLVRSIDGLNSPQGVTWVPDAGRLFVSNAGDGTIDVFDGNSFAPVGKIALLGDADNMRYDSGTKLLYVGYGSGGIASINTTSDSLVMTSTLPAHPESFQVETSGRAIYVNVPSSNLITAVDKITGDSILNRSMTGSNFPMALDEADGRLFIATRSPPELKVLDTTTLSLKSVANMTIAGDPDDIFYDPAHGLVFVSCGGGSLEVIKQVDASHYSLAQTIATGQGARTSLLVPELGSIFVAVPAGTGQQAEILVYAIGSVGSGSTTSSSTSLAPIPTSASLSVAPGSGPSGLMVTLTGAGYFPSTRYQVCVAVVGNMSCGLRYTSAGYPTTIGNFAVLGSFTADSAGNIPSGNKVMIPDLFGGGYLIGVVPDGKDVFFVSTSFTVEQPTLSMNVASVASGGNVTLTGDGYAPSTTYTVCVVPSHTVDCGYEGDREETPPGYLVGTFTVDASGNIPLGTAMTVPQEPPGQYAIGIFMPGGGHILISEAQFTLTGAG